MAPTIAVEGVPRAAATFRNALQIGGDFTALEEAAELNERLFWTITYLSVSSHGRSLYCIVAK